MTRRVRPQPEPEAGNIAGADPHRKTVSVTVLDARGGLLGTKHFKVSGVGHRAMWDWVQTFGPLDRFGIENASGIGRHTSTFLSSVVLTSATCVRRVPPSKPGGDARASPTRSTRPGSHARR
jgi:hypothetical protein